VAIIYKITNKINGKFYIGKTVSSLEKRISSHKKDRRNITPLTRAIDKYGWENFDVEVLWRGKISEVNEREIFFIKETNAIKNGYNCTYGGDGWMPGERHPFYGKQRPDDVKKKISETKKNGYHPTRGKKLPQWWIDKCKPGRGELHWNSKRYIVISPEGVEYKIKGLIDFCKKHDLQQTLMSHVAAGKRNHHKGWKCFYDKEE